MRARSCNRARSDYNFLASDFFEEDVYKIEKKFLNAAWDGDIKKIERLLDERQLLIFNIDARDSFGNTALLHSIANHHYKISRLLIRHGCDVTASNDKNESIVSLSPNNCVSLLVDSTSEGSANMRLCRASWIADYQTVDYILNNEACDVNCRNIDGLTPLLLLVCGLKTFYPITPILNSAFQYSPIDTLKSLIAKRCDVNITDSITNFSAIHFLASYNQPISVHFMQTLIQHNCSIRERDVNDATGLHIACETGNMEAVKLLISNDLDMQTTDSHLNTPLHYAARGGQQLIASYLLYAGANVEAANDEGLTPLQLAPQNSTCRALLATATRKCDVLDSNKGKKQKIKYSSIFDRTVVTPNFDSSTLSISQNYHKNVSFLKESKESLNSISENEKISEDENLILAAQDDAKDFIIESTWVNKSSDSGCHLDPSVSYSLHENSNSSPHQPHSSNISPYQSPSNNPLLQHSMPSYISTHPSQSNNALSKLDTIDSNQVQLCPDSFYQSEFIQASLNQPKPRHSSSKPAQSNYISSQRPNPCITSIHEYSTNRFHTNQSKSNHISSNSQGIILPLLQNMQTFIKQSEDTHNIEDKKQPNDKVFIISPLISFEHLQSSKKTVIQPILNLTSNQRASSGKTNDKFMTLKFTKPNKNKDLNGYTLKSLGHNKIKMIENNIPLYVIDDTKNDKLSSMMKQTTKKLSFMNRPSTGIKALSNFNRFNVEYKHDIINQQLMNHCGPVITDYFESLKRRREEEKDLNIPHSPKILPKIRPVTASAAIKHDKNISLNKNKLIKTSDKMKGGRKSLGTKAKSSNDLLMNVDKQDDAFFFEPSTHHIKKEKSTDCDSALIPLHCVHG